MKTAFNIFIFLIIYSISFSQDSTSVFFYYNKLRKNYPKEKFTLVEKTTDNYKNSYQYDKKTKVLFNLFSISLSHDSSFVFYYLNNEVFFCSFRYRINPKKRKGLIFSYYVNNGNLIPIKNKKELTPPPLFLIKKGDQLYQRGKHYLQLKQTK